MSYLPQVLIDLLFNFPFTPITKSVDRMKSLVFSVHEVHIIALSILDTTDSSIIRFIVDYPEEAQKLLIEHRFSYVQSELVAVELDSEADIKRVTSALVQAEINIHYTYPFLSRPMGKPALAISLEDNDLAKDTLARHQLRVIGQNDIVDKPANSIPMPAKRSRTNTEAFSKQPGDRRPAVASRSASTTSPRHRRRQSSTATSAT